MSTPRVLFILKQRPSGPYGSWSYSVDGRPLPSGLSNSVNHLVRELDKQHVDCAAVQVVDNNCIDREVTKYRPTHVVIEAFWVVPEKFVILKKLHPNVVWIVRNHSKSDFLSHEGGKVNWAIEYVRNNVYLACNSPEAVRDFRQIAQQSNVDPNLVIYLPNAYTAPTPKRLICTMLWTFLRAIGIYGRRPRLKVPGQISVGCYGAIRPLKNHQNQAIAAMGFADMLGVKLKFHVNSTRVEGNANSLLQALRKLFESSPHELVEDPWMDTPDFIAALGRLDMLTQVSLSETFNIVAADAVTAGIPVLGSAEIPWLPDETTSRPYTESILHNLRKVWRRSGNGYLHSEQVWLLSAYNRRAVTVWMDYLFLSKC